MRVMKLTFKDGKKVNGWSSSKPIKEATLSEFQDANLRDLYDDEIILDCETTMQGKFLKDILVREGIGFTMWDTGSRGFHISIRIKGLAALSDKERFYYREAWIKKYGTDMAKRNGFIAMEDRPHFKTGNYKRLTFTNNIINKIDMDLVREIKSRLFKIDNEKPKSFNSSIDIQNIKQKLKITDLWKKWGLQKKGSNWDTPFGTSVNKSCVNINDKKGVWYDFNTMQGGDIITAVELKHNCGFIEAVQRLKDGDY